MNVTQFVSGTRLLPYEPICLLKNTFDSFALGTTYPSSSSFGKAICPEMSLEHLFSLLAVHDSK
jgi:hypothetical protein